MSDSPDGHSQPDGHVPAAPQQPAAWPPPQPAPPAPPAHPGQFTAGPVPLNNNLGWAIGGILACWPFGIPALIKALEVNSLWWQGQFEQAEHSARQAKKWGKIAVITAGVLFGLYVLFMIAYVVFFVWMFRTAGDLGS